ncbi:MAG TPA: hypothetical protein PLE21_00295 [Giesbergeria sp.]|nr:hypothetical protein [Giesbergeria sp.]
MQDTTGPNIHAIAVTAKANADDGALSAIAAAAQVPLAAAQVALATTQAQLAADAANAAAATAGATQWVSGTVYTAGYCVWSPFDQQVYRRKTAGAGTIDPSADAANWTFVSVKPTIPRSTRTSNTMIGAADNSTLIDITSGTFTQTFDAAATLGGGWFCYVKNSGTGDITLDPDAAEQIDGLASYVMYPNEVRLVQCDGVALRSVVLNSFYRAFTASGSFARPPGYRAFGCDIISGGSGGGAERGGGGGGRYLGFVPSSVLAPTGTVTVGSGGTGSTTNTINPGGASSFAGVIVAGASQKHSPGYAGAGGSVGDVSVSTSVLAGGLLGGFGNNSVGEGGSAEYGGGGGAIGYDGGSSLFGGGGGGGASAPNYGIGGKSGTNAGGTKNPSGNGGNGAAAPDSRFSGGGGGGGSNFGGNGGLPGGAGGGGDVKGGAGARGEIRIWGII